MKLWQKITLSVLLAVNICLMFMTWFGGEKGVQEISGTIVLKNPFTIVFIIIIIAGIWIRKAEKFQNPLIYTGFAGIMAVEIYEFFTWYTKTVSLNNSMIKSLNMAFPEFYLGLIVTVASLTTAVLFGYCRYRLTIK